MRRLLLPAFLVVGLVACGSPAETPAGEPLAPADSLPTSAPAEPADPEEEAEGPEEPAGAEGAIPALDGDPTDLSAPSQAAAGTGAPPTELLTEDVVVGSGQTAIPADTVDVHYTGTLWDDGSVFDSSWERGEPIAFPLSEVVPGFAQGIDGMAPGGRRVIVMPPELAYGDDPPPGLPAGATLVFVVDLIGIT